MNEVFHNSFRKKGYKRKYKGNKLNLEKFDTSLYK